MDSRWSDVTAVFGGSFNPPHAGHRAAVEGLLENPGVKQVVILPTYQSPLKLKGEVSAEQRLEMVKLCFAGLGERVIIDDFELVRGKKTGRPSYSFDTLSELKREYNNIAFVVGADQLAMFTQWYRFKETLELCHWIVLNRKPEGYIVARTALGELASNNLVYPTSHSSSWTTNTSQILLVDTPAENISSTKIREKIDRLEKLGANDLNENVKNYIAENGLYGVRV